MIYPTQTNLRVAFFSVALYWLVGAVNVCAAAQITGPPGNDSTKHPNIVLIMADDLGWGDTSYNGHPILKTPHLDQMAGEGIRFERFYAGSAVCSPTRASVLTGRHSSRTGILGANNGHLKQQEINLAEYLKRHGYTTGHFGKWHLGTLTEDVRDSNRGGRPDQTAHYAPPWDHGFDVCFSTEAKVPTWDPMRKPKQASRRGWNYLKPGDPWDDYGTRYWSGPGRTVSENLQGDDSKIIIDRVLDFIRKAAQEKKPFLAVVWFHAPHWPVVAGPEHAALYANAGEHEKNFFGCITAMDQQIGRLRNELSSQGVADNSLLWFCSDNGPEGNVNDTGQTGGLRGRKRSLYEGGIRVPATLVWPKRVTSPLQSDFPCCTNDILPTIVDLLGENAEALSRPLDGISLLPTLTGQNQARLKPIAFRQGKQLALIGQRDKLYRAKPSGKFELYEISKDPFEKHDLASSLPAETRRMVDQLDAWLASSAASAKGADYPSNGRSESPNAK